MKKVYPILISENNGTYLVYVPDMDIYTEGHDMADAVSMARDAIGFKGIALEDEQVELPEPSDYSHAVTLAKKNADIFDFELTDMEMKTIDALDEKFRSAGIPEDMQGFVL